MEEVSLSSPLSRSDTSLMSLGSYLPYPDIYVHPLLRNIETIDTGSTFPLSLCTIHILADRTTESIPITDRRDWQSIRIRSRSCRLSQSQAILSRQYYKRASSSNYPLPTRVIHQPLGHDDHLSTLKSPLQVRVRPARLHLSKLHLRPGGIPISP